MTRKRIDQRLRELIDAAVSERLSDEERLELDRHLREDDDALAAFLDCCQLETDLFFHVRATLAGRRAISDLRLIESIAEGATSELPLPVAPATERPTVVAKRRNRLAALISASPVRSLMALAATVVLGAFAWWATNYWREIPAERQPQPIARLTDADGAEWLDKAPKLGHSFVEGDSVYLRKGRARISMSSGAELVLRAPCFVTLSRSDEVQLEEGMVTAEVADWGRGFTVVTDALRVVDLGTKFGVSTNGLGVAEAHVLKGQVRIQPISASAAERRSLLLSDGEAIRVGSDRRAAVRLAANRQQYDAEMGDQTPFKPIHIFNTGAGLVAGDEDPHWRIISGPASASFKGPEFAVVCDADSRYLANDPARSQWISATNPVRPGLPPSSLYTFETSFDLTGYDLPTVMAAAQVIADNGVRAVRLNGQPVPMNAWELNEQGQTFNKFNVVEFTEGFVQGLNKVEFDVWNGVDRYTPDAANPMALRVEWQAFGRPIQLAAAAGAVVQ